MRFKVPVAAAVVGTFAVSLFLQVRLTPIGLARLASFRPAHATGSERPASQLEAQPVVDATLQLIRRKYFEPARVDPRRMFLSALTRMRDEAPGSLISYDGHSAQLVLRAGVEERTFQVNDIQGPWDVSAHLREVFAFYRHALGRGAPLRALEYAACDGILQTLDPLSGIIRPESYTQMLPAADAAATGVAISIRDNALTIVHLLPGPAAKAGLLVFDRITQIDNESTVNMNLDEAVNRLRGKRGSRVTLRVERDGPLGWQNSKLFELIRRPVRIASVYTQRLGPGIGYVHLDKFQASTADELDHALSDLSSEGPLQGLVLDLRDNFGGLLAQATAVADRFLDEGVIAITQGAAEGREQKVAQRAQTQPPYPIVVLQNAVSASASEIVSGALQKLDRAVIVGERSAGAGTVQLVFPHLDPEGAALKLTIAQFLLAGDVPVAGVGVTPDVVLEAVTIEPSNLRWLSPEQARGLGRAARTMTTSDSEAPSLVRFEVPAAESLRSKAESQDDAPFEADFQVRFARDLVARMSSGGRKKALASAQGFIESTRRTEAHAIGEHLRRLDIDWTAPPPTERARASEGDLRVSVVTDRAHDTALAGQPMTMTVRVTNQGAWPIYRLSAVTRSQGEYFDGREFLFGRIAPGKTVSASAALGQCEARGQGSPLLPALASSNRAPDCRIPIDAPSRQDIVKVSFSAEGGEPPLDAELRPSITSVPRPAKQAASARAASSTSPRLELAPVALAVRGESLRIAGNVRHSAPIVDVAASSRSGRLAYLPSQGAPDPTKLEFAFDVALEPGINVIDVTARASDEAAAHRTVVVRRDGPNGEALAPASTRIDRHHSSRDWAPPRLTP